MSVCSYIIRKIDVIPSSRLQTIRDSELARCTEATRHTRPCGGFSTQYACMCDLYGLPYREEVTWVKFLLPIYYIYIYTYMKGLGYNAWIVRNNYWHCLQLGRRHHLLVSRYTGTQLERFRSSRFKGPYTNYFGSRV